MAWQTYDGSVPMTRKASRISINHRGQVCFGVMLSSQVPADARWVQVSYDPDRRLLAFRPVTARSRGCLVLWRKPHAGGFRCACRRALRQLGVLPEDRLGLEGRWSEDPELGWCIMADVPDGAEDPATAARADDGGIAPCGPARNDPPPNAEGAGRAMAGGIESPLAGRADPAGDTCERCKYQRCALCQCHTAPPDRRHKGVDGPWRQACGEFMTRSQVPPASKPQKPKARHTSKPRGRCLVSDHNGRDFPITKRGILPHDIHGVTYCADRGDYAHPCPGSNQRPFMEPPASEPPIIHNQ